MRAEAFAKVNLSLRVAAPRSDGLHPLRSWFLSVSWADTLDLERATGDRIEVDGDAPGGEENLAWRAAESVRRAAGAKTGMGLRLAKEIPAAAGLGGGSADAAAALALAGRLFGVPDDVLAGFAPALGADVPFCFRGGCALVTGAGEAIAPLPLPAGFALAVVVPPFVLPTPEVFARWDRMDGPTGRPAPDRSLPPSLRGGEPLQNDLYSAAASLEPDLDAWRADLARSWGTPVLMSGSGPALFGLFGDQDEARHAASVAPAAARGAAAVAPVPAGWRLDAGTLGERGDSPA